MRPRLASCFVGAILAVEAACSHEIHRPPPGQDPTTVQPGGSSGGGAVTGGGGAVTDGGGADVAVDALAACNAITITRGVVDQIGVTGDPPAGAGGTLVDGTYDLTDATYFAGTGGIGPTGVSYKETIQLDGATMQQARATLGGGRTVEARRTSTVALSGARASISETCPAPSGAQSWGYTATGDTLSLISATARTEFVYTKR